MCSPFPGPLCSFLAPPHRRDDPKTLPRQDRALPSGSVLRVGRCQGCGNGAQVHPQLLPEAPAGPLGGGKEPPAGFLLKGDSNPTWGASFFLVAFTRAAGLGPLAPGVHDEVLPRDQGEGRNEEDHRAVRSQRQTAGQWRAWAGALGGGDGSTPLRSGLQCSGAYGSQGRSRGSGPSPTQPCLQTAGIPVFKDKGT